ncbi:TetR/AcrR family transcriptional regulator [Clostridiaceae bacterium UIB06]|uniref:TetR/AcrR family transcriptional regulator n=1 Tax=Clostridium thailandense TaxID=2794346 RepID=A0A949TTX6_9CLOT|nr:TetR/AcrR family transcriptional regulator [Clostridium thailandense]MBV7271831.1 TetR/AcrR family transcriptional regulator [Clostridium thailandense]MCH5135627.1 TetR/AcrR family transcriptional regulator [Clostridiaceae bacterium UIB06]
MTDTKEKMLIVALKLFARDGYETVSVSTIAGELGMTKSALYKHYKNKRHILDSIVERMNQMDYERAKEYEVPEETINQMPEAYVKTDLEKISIYSEAQFRYWTEGEFSSNFRKMLTLEQYRNHEMSTLYQQYLVRGPLEYMKDLFVTMINITKEEAWQLALEFYAPIFILYSVYDGCEDKQKIFDLLDFHIDSFTNRIKSMKP